MSQKRHDLVHGVVVSIKSINGTSPIDKLDYQAHEHIMQPIEFGPTTFDAIAQELLDLGKGLTVFGRSRAEKFRRL